MNFLKKKRYKRVHVKYFFDTKTTKTRLEPVCCVFRPAFKWSKYFFMAVQFQIFIISKYTRYNKEILNCQPAIAWQLKISYSFKNITCYCV